MIDPFASQFNKTPDVTQGATKDLEGVFNTANQSTIPESPIDKVTPQITRPDVPLQQNIMSTPQSTPEPLGTTPQEQQNSSLYQDVDWMSMLDQDYGVIHNDQPNPNNMPDFKVENNILKKKQVTYGELNSTTTKSLKQDVQYINFLNKQTGKYTGIGSDYGISAEDTDRYYRILAQKGIIKPGDATAVLYNSAITLFQKAKTGDQNAQMQYQDAMGNLKMELYGKINSYEGKMYGQYGDSAWDDPLMQSMENAKKRIKKLAFIKDMNGEQLKSYYTSRIQEESNLPTVLYKAPTENKSTNAKASMINNPWWKNYISMIQDPQIRGQLNLDSNEPTITKLETQMIRNIRSWAAPIQNAYDQTKDQLGWETAEKMFGPYKQLMDLEWVDTKTGMDDLIENAVGKINPLSANNIDYSAVIAGINSSSGGSSSGGGKSYNNQSYDSYDPEAYRKEQQSKADINESIYHFAAREAGVDETVGGFQTPKGINPNLFKGSQI